MCGGGLDKARMKMKTKADFKCRGLSVGQTKLRTFAMSNLPLVWLSKIGYATRRTTLYLLKISQLRYYCLSRILCRQTVIFVAFEAQIAGSQVRCRHCTWAILGVRYVGTPQRHEFVLTWQPCYSSEQHALLNNTSTTTVGSSSSL